MKQNFILSKSPLFTHKNVHYLCIESYYKSIYSLDFQDYQFEQSDPEFISENLPTDIRKQIRELGDSYYTIAVIPDEKVKDFSNRLKAYLKEKLEKIIKAREISDADLYDYIPDLIQNLAALQDINKDLQLDDIIALVNEIDKFAILSQQIFFY